ncbi:MAG TPA: hypothetical protein VFE92_12130 [Dermatophilaceae bacterium]|jgi:cyclopropane-fatty-acyl-phospholipid synthase|nr:hypothetical protein [Dermatophilaceae bacterium]
MVGALEEAGFEVRDVEPLREHYALTLRAGMPRSRASLLAPAVDASATATPSAASPTVLAPRALAPPVSPGA